MPRVTRVLAALALLGSALVAVPGSASTPATFEKHAYAEGHRDYWLYVPADVGPSPAVVVYLHGCLETARMAAHATRFNELADREGFVVAYPEQLVPAGSSAPLTDGNGAGCWNWFLTDDQQRGTGEPAAIAGLAQQVVHDVGGDPSRVYLSGISAGGDMAAILAATYPDVFAAVAVQAGCAYATCSDTTGELSVRAMGEHARVVPMLIENGTADTLNNMAMAETLVSSWIGATDAVDDGARNGSVPVVPTSVDTVGIDQAPAPGSGDACVHNSSWTCPGGVVGWDSYPYTVEHHADAAGCDLVQLWAIHGLEHAHPNAPAGDAFSDPLGPDITTASWRFFQQHTLAGPCTG